MTEELVARQVEREPWEAPAHVNDPVTSPLEPRHASVDALHKPARRPTRAIVRDLIPPPIERAQHTLAPKRVGRGRDGGVAH
jgi:hypothetical protein